jgi:hypothetical protein
VVGRALADCGGVGVHVGEVGPLVPGVKPPVARGGLRTVEAVSVARALWRVEGILFGRRAGPREGCCCCPQSPRPQPRPAAGRPTQGTLGGTQQAQTDHPTARPQRRAARAPSPLLAGHLFGSFSNQTRGVVRYQIKPNQAPRTGRRRRAPPRGAPAPPSRGP